MWEVSRPARDVQLQYNTEYVRGLREAAFFLERAVCETKGGEEEVQEDKEDVEVELEAM